jgi:hypothetical protein
MLNRDVTALAAEITNCLLATGSPTEERIHICPAARATERTWLTIVYEGNGFL